MLGGGTTRVRGLRVNDSLWKANDKGTVEATPNPEKPLTRIDIRDKIETQNFYWNFKCHFLLYMET
ncbi:hypothetical protein WEN_03110 [Mycoplasma wenyonii str. Massachusetts]|uniref:Uncharacterized protein n=1 Tax=Mycoplasma wenyonii (strain Massachusetts) TaxID=1197325 RepID=I6Z707_MYCWM|nr:hypothetical protein [Mycoplasma wenyonii]AFN65403.1 hypothetical protein WEN_03110 [Mycoplasma wenyonii str. Massachusetts]